MTKTQHYYAVILAGGGGTRLWPKSRNDTPKQFLKLGGNRTMLQITADRVKKILPWKQIIVISNKLYEKDVKQQLPKIPAKNIISEPEKKDTALAMLVGSLYAKSLDSKAVVMNVASDHVVVDDKEYQRVILKALEIAENNDYLVTVGITPAEPNTGFGYIKSGDEISKLYKNLSLYQVDKFIEKPDLATAKKYVISGNYYWNANMYVWSVNSIIKAFEQHKPKMLILTKKLEKLSFQKFHNALAEIYKQADKISIDYAISEKADNLVLIPGDFGWNDVGLWTVVYELGQKNKDKNVILNDEKGQKTVAIQSSKNLIHTDKRLIALLGVEDMVIIDTQEILLIVPKKQCQDIKQIVEAIKRSKKAKYL